MAHVAASTMGYRELRSEIEVPSVENQELSKIPSVKSELGQKIALHDSPAAGNSAFEMSAFPVHPKSSRVFHFSASLY